MDAVTEVDGRNPDEIVCVLVQYPEHAQRNPDLLRSAFEGMTQAFQGTPFASVPVVVLPVGWTFEAKRKPEAEPAMVGPLRPAVSDTAPLRTAIQRLVDEQSRRHYEAVEKKAHEFMEETGLPAEAIEVVYLDLPNGDSRWYIRKKVRP